MRIWCDIYTISACFYEKISLFSIRPISYLVCLHWILRINHKYLLRTPSESYLFITHNNNHFLYVYILQYWQSYAWRLSVFFVFSIWTVPVLYEQPHIQTNEWNKSVLCTSKQMKAIMNTWYLIKYNRNKKCYRSKWRRP